MEIHINSWDYEDGEEVELKPIFPGMWVIPEIDYDLGDDCVYIENTQDVKEVAQVVIDGAVARVFEKTGDNPIVKIRCGDRILKLKLVDK